jgi:hypothetical protein
MAFSPLKAQRRQETTYVWRLRLVLGHPIMKMMDVDLTILVETIKLEVSARRRVSGIKKSSPFVLMNVFAILSLTVL